jgi:hypothetical protein
MLPDYAPNWLHRFRFPEQSLQAIRVVQTGSSQVEVWTVNELRVYGKSLELPRSPEWRLVADPNPWFVQSAFDNSPLTGWNAGDTLRPGMSLLVMFGKPQAVDSVLLEMPFNQWSVRLRLEGQDQAGNWKALSTAPEVSRRDALPDMRRAAIQELKYRGYTHLLVFPGDVGANDFRTRSIDWGISLIGERGSGRLYKLD